MADTVRGFVCLQQADNMGRKAARELRENASTMDGTAIIEHEYCVPNFNPEKDYSQCPVGTPVKDKGQAFKLLRPYNASFFPQRPNELRAMWSLCHTKNPAKAKPWVPVQGSSGPYEPGECYKDDDGVVHRCIAPAPTNFSADPGTGYPAYWEIVEV